jgi:hypothetical protein
VNEVGSQYTDLDRDYFGEFMGAYREGKERRKQDRLDKQEQALRISEMLGEVPPELEGDILGPVQPMPPTLGERAVGGLGRLIGIDTEMGQQPEPFELPEGAELKPKTQREAEAATLKHQRGLERLQEESDIDLAQQRTEVEEELKFVDSQEKKLERIRVKAQQEALKPGKQLSAKERLQNDLYSGKKNLANMTTEDFLILDKYWSASTPAARTKDAIKIATDLWGDSQKGKAKKGTKKERQEFIDEVSREIIAKQDELMAQIQEQEAQSRGLYGVAGQGGDKRSLDNIWGVR